MDFLQMSMKGKGMGDLLQSAGVNDFSLGML
jgi:hypothetical protein